MKLVALAVSFVASILCGNAAFAFGDGSAWVRQCVANNQSGAITTGVAAKYCGCMNDRLTVAVSQASSPSDKAHVTACKAADLAVGWR